jgi:hypothetical protein
MGSHTATALAQIIQLSQDKANPYVRDVFFPFTGLQCDSVDKPFFDFKVMADGQCWHNVHPDLYNVYVFNFWAQDVNAHPGKATPIKRFADGDNPTFFLTFPGPNNMQNAHPIDR